jgi:transcriptional regulator of arginine metabolism
MQLAPIVNNYFSELCNPLSTLTRTEKINIVAAVVGKRFRACHYKFGLISMDNEILLKALDDILSRGTSSTQQEICEELAGQGFQINQSKISRMLHKLGAIKVKNPHGQTGYRLTKDLLPPPSQTPLKQLIVKIATNETLVIIQTSPGSASLIARMLDYQNSESEILATLAGDDTIFVAPKSIKRIHQTFQEVKKLLAGIEPNRS